MLFKKNKRNIINYNHDGRQDSSNGHNKKNNGTKFLTHKRSNVYYCGNCGKYGHVYKHCKEPLISTGIILIDIKQPNDESKIMDNITKRFNNNKSKNIFDGSNGIMYNNSKKILSLFCEYKNNIKFLMIRRKHSLGYIEFVRGRYDIQDFDGIIYLFAQMMKEEIKRVETWKFDNLWKDLWSNDNPPYHNEYIKSKNKFEKLKEGIDTDIELEFYVRNVTPEHTHTEWGFPKGRRNYRENDLECAIREFTEETGYKKGEYTICMDIVPIVENLIGTNGRNYKHIYYVAINKKQQKDISLDPNNKHQVHEIGDIGWFTYDNIRSDNFLRRYHKDRKKIVTRLYTYIINNIISAKLNHLR